MIKNLTASGRYVQVQGGSPAQMYINNYSGAMGVGDVRFNTGNQSLQVYDGNSWQDLQGAYSMVGLTAEAESLLDWARDQRNKQYEIEALAKTSTAVAIAVENLNKAKAQLEATVILSKEHNEVA